MVSTKTAVRERLRQQLGAGELVLYALLERTMRAGGMAFQMITLPWCRCT
jgi:hypothetical protein